MLLFIGVVSLFGSIIIDFSLPIFVGLIINNLSTDPIDWYAIKMDIFWLSFTIFVSAITSGTRGYSFNTMS